MLLIAMLLSAASGAATGAQDVVHVYEISAAGRTTPAHLTWVESDQSIQATFFTNKRCRVVVGPRGQSLAEDLYAFIRLSITPISNHDAPDFAARAAGTPGPETPAQPGLTERELTYSGFGGAAETTIPATGIGYVFSIDRAYAAKRFDLTGDGVLDLYDVELMHDMLAGKSIAQALSPAESPAATTGPNQPPGVAQIDPCLAIQASLLRWMADGLPVSQDLESVATSSGCCVVALNAMLDLNRDGEFDEQDLRFLEQRINQ